jgi:hypothetical protein
MRWLRRLDSACCSARASNPIRSPGTFNVPRSELASTGRSAWFILEPGYASRSSRAAAPSWSCTVLAETKLVDGVETRIVEEREAEHGKLIEVFPQLLRDPSVDRRRVLLRRSGRPVQGR